MIIKYNNHLISYNKIDLWNEITFCKDNEFIVTMHKRFGMNMYFYHNSKCHLIDFQKYNGEYNDGFECLYIYDLDHPLFIYDDDDDDDDEIKPQNIKDKYIEFYNYLINFHSVLNTVLMTHNSS